MAFQGVRIGVIAEPLWGVQETNVVEVDAASGFYDRPAKTRCVSVILAARCVLAHFRPLPGCGMIAALTKISIGYLLERVKGIIILWAVYFSTQNARPEDCDSGRAS